MKLTIRSRLSLMFAFSAVLVLFGISVFIYLFTLHFRKTEFRHRLQDRLVEADSLLRKNSLYPVVTLDHMPPGTLPQERFFYVKPTDPVRITQGRDTITLARLEDLKQHTYFFAQKDDRSYLVHWDTKLGNVIVVSAVDVFGQTLIRTLRRTLIAGIVLGTLAMAFISWYWPKKQLQPITDKIKKARRIGAESLNLRLDVKNDYDELGQLATTFNQMLDRIEKAFEAQKQFISNAAHELRNPITVISGDAQLALMQPRSAEEYNAALTRIKGRSDDLKRLVDRLLILSKIEASKSGFSKKQVRIDELLIDAIASVQNRYNGKTPPMKLHIQEEPSDAYTFLGDAVMLQMAFDNVLENAIKYGSSKPVTVALLKKGKQTVLNVQDEGIGINGTEEEKVFQPFYRTENVRHIQGMGIGLALVKSILEWHGWKIILTPNHPKGTKVVILFS